MFNNMKRARLDSFFYPVLDLDRIIKSSAYKSEVISIPFRRANGSNIVFSNKYCKLFIKRLNKRRLKIHP